MLYDQIDKNKRRTLYLFAGFAVLVFAVSWAIDVMFLEGDLLTSSIIAIVIWIGAVTFAWFAADRVVLSSMGVRPPNPQHPREAQLTEMVEGLALAASMPVPTVYVVDDPSPNAFATGRTPEKGVVVFTTGLLGKMTRPQTEAVAAHELSHIANRDSMVGVLAAVLVGTLLILGRLVTRMMFFGGGRGRSNNSGGGAAPVMLVIGLLFVVIAPMLGTLLRLAISRRRESLADANAVRLTRNPDAMIGALQVLDGDHSQVDFQHGLASHLWIEEPGDKRHREGRIARLFNTHPPIPERIAALRGIRGDGEAR